MRYLPLLGVTIGCLVLAGAAVQPAVAGAATSGTTTQQQIPTAVTDAHGDEGSHEEEGHEESNGGLGLVHLTVEVLQILFAAAAVGSVVLAGRVYGGEVGRALLISGVGVTLFAVQRLWHNFHELGVVARPTAVGQQGLFILSAGALAAGYLSLYQTMDKRMG